MNLFGIKIGLVEVLLGAAAIYLVTRPKTTVVGMSERDIQAGLWNERIRQLQKLHPQHAYPAPKLALD